MNIAALVNRSHPVSSKTKNYQQLYEELKENTATFIKLVEAELSKVLTQHKKEKAWLEKENYQLRELLKEKGQPSPKEQLTPRKQQSAARNLGVGSLWENTRDIINCGISDISLDESKSILTDRKKYSFLQSSLEEKFNKENIMTSRQINPKSVNRQGSTFHLTASYQSTQGPHHSFTSRVISEEQGDHMSLIRDRLPSRRGVKNVCCLGEKEEVSEMLKKIREKASTPKALNPRRKQAQYFERDIIVPGMYSLNKKRA